MARSAVYTEFFTLIDVDLQPSPALRKKFLAFIAAQGAWEEQEDEKEVYIIPAFEMAANQGTYLFKKIFKNIKLF